MTPYFQRGGVQLFCGDVREILPALTEPFDLAICDPPYGETSLEWDRWSKGWVAAVVSALKPNGSLWCFGSMRMFLQHRDEFDTAGLRFVQDVIWEKQNGSGFISDRFKRVHEVACHFVRDGAAWADVFKEPPIEARATAGRKSVRARGSISHTGQIAGGLYLDDGTRLRRSIIQVPNCHGFAENETQKPVGIVEPLIAYSCPPKGRVLVPFAGSGTDLEICFTRGLTAVGCELREQQAEVAARRLSQLLDLNGRAA